MSEQVDCQCSQRNDALWSYCSDDYYCPQCGVKVTRLISKNRFEPNSDGDEIWVYAQKAKDQDSPVFTFPLAVNHSDQTRIVHRRKPTIDFRHSQAEGNNYFSPTLEPAESNNPEVDRVANRPYRLQLNRLEKNDLPPEGVRLRIPRLVGDFSDDEHLVLRVGNKPSIRVELIGSGLEQSKDSGTVVRLAHAGELEVTLRIHAENAPVRVNRPLNNENIHSSPDIGEFPAITGQVSLRIANELPGGTVIEPGTPWSTPAKLYASALSIPGQRVTISLNFDVLVASIDQLSLTLERVEKGGVAFDPPSLFLIDAMYLGESRSNALNDKRENPEDPGCRGYRPVIRRLSICNLGRERIVLDSPTVINEHPVKWLSVRWATDVSDGTVTPLHEQLELEPHDRGEIHVHVDLRNVPVERLTRNCPLTAVIQARQLSTGEVFEINVMLQEVRDRIPCPSPLCIDFGNTSSFASVKRHRDFPWSLPSEIADVHELRLPEAFHTVLFFNHTADDPFASECEIGDLAIAGAAKFAASSGAGALVSDLKRWIGDPTHTKTVTDPRGHSNPDHTKQFRVADLVVLFLVRLIERAELILRRYTIQEICVSHPSKFDAARRREFYALIDRVCERVTANRPSRPLTRVKADVDEANAVAVGAVFEQEICGDFLRELFQKQRSDFVVACIDLGGGSLDTAVMRFEVRNRSLFRPRFKSEYLGIGGHSGFGGDNVTLAFLECLLDRIHQCLEQNGLPAAVYLRCVPEPLKKDSHEQLFVRRNYQILWEVAERVKLHQCRLNVLTPGEQSAEALAELEPLSSFVQTRLVNDLILMPRISGRIQIDPAVAAAMKTLVEQRGFLVPLSEVYDHAFRSVLSEQPRESASLSVREHIGDALQDLHDLAAAHNAEVEVIVLAGAGCRLPLVGELVNKHFPAARVVDNPSRTKFRVAHGLVRFLDAATGGHKFACSSHYSTFAYEVGCEDMGRKAPAIPNCASLRQPEKWYRVLVPRELTNGVDTVASIDEIISHDGSRRVHVFRVEEDQSRLKHGWFDLDSPPLPATDHQSMRLSDEELLSHEATAEIRLIDSETNMELRVNLPTGRQYSWKLVPARLETR